MPKYERHPWLEGSDHPRNCDRRQSVFGGHFVSVCSWTLLPGVDSIRGHFLCKFCQERTKSRRSDQERARSKCPRNKAFQAADTKKPADQGSTGLCSWRKERDSNPRCPKRTCRLSRAVQSTTLPSFRGLCFTDQIVCSPESENAHYAHSFAIVQEIDR